MMSSLLPTSAIFVATDPVDLRKAFDGLATLVRKRHPRHLPGNRPAGTPRGFNLSGYSIGA